jgi:hypothetical protein
MRQKNIARVIFSLVARAVSEQVDNLGGRGVATFPFFGG